MNKEEEYKKLGLPNEVTIYYKDLKEDEDDIDEGIANYLSNKYGFCVGPFMFRICKDRYEVYDIEWDISE